MAAAGGVAAVGTHSMAHAAAQDTGKTAVGEILGQGALRFRANRMWGLLDRARYPVKDCHGIAEDRSGRIVMLTNETRNNLIAYSKEGEFIAAWESRFPAAHGFEITNAAGEERYWITDHDRQLVSACTPDGRELFRSETAGLSRRYPDMNKYHPTNSASLPDGDFYVSDGYGSSFVHHFDPQGRYIASFGGEGAAPENLKEPHAVWIDTRSGKPRLLVCDRGHQQLKWFSLEGALLNVVDVPGAMPSNATRMNGRYADHLVITSLNSMLLIIDGSDRVVCVVGGDAPVYDKGKLQSLSPYNYTFAHPHDTYADSANSLYVAQWWSGQTYPLKLELLGDAR
jgi:peptidylamidoglycolate lyase